jgi:hypothetical protein
VKLKFGISVILASLALVAATETSASSKVGYTCKYRFTGAGASVVIDGSDNGVAFCRAFNRGAKAQRFYGPTPGRLSCRLEARRFDLRMRLNSVVLRLEELQEFADLVAVLGGVTHGDVSSDAVAVSTADPFALDVARFDQVGDDALGGSFGDSNALGDVTEPRVRVAVEAKKYLGVIREEPPRLLLVAGT